MKFEFFTMGGCQFWEDVFFYQKWRIQRNSETKTCRLLDPWDIRRHQGSFESCRKAFFKYIEVYELPRQKGHMVIMLHGLFDSKNIFKPLWRAALKEGFMAAAINYPSSQKHLDSHVRQLDFFLNNLVDVQEVSFVTKGVGGLILRSLLNMQNRDWQKKMKIGRVVQICPPNKGSRLFGKLSKYKAANMVLGPMLNDAKPAKAAYIPNFPAEYEVGIIDSDSLLKKALRLWSGSNQNAFFAEKEAYLDNAKEILYVDNWHPNPLKNPEIVNKTIQFLKNGTFEGFNLQKIKKL